MWPSALMASALGVLPKSSFSAGFVEMVSTTLLVCVSMTEIVSLWAFATRTWLAVGRGDKTGGMQADDDFLDVA